MVTVKILRDVICEGATMRMGKIVPVSDERAVELILAGNATLVGKGKDVTIKVPEPMRVMTKAITPGEIKTGGK